MTMLQVIAAEMAGIAHLFFHIGDPTGEKALASSHSVLCELPWGHLALPKSGLVERITPLEYEWESGDGN